MPDVDEHQDPAVVFAQARRVSAGTVEASPEWRGVRSVAIVTPGRLVMPVAFSPANAATPEMLSAIRQMVAETPKQQITVIADNNVIATKAWTAREAGALIPFLGYLMGMAFDAHNVVVFEGHPSALAAGCAGATLLMVDEAMVERLQPDWLSVAASVMKPPPQILILGRDGSVTRLVRDGTSLPPPPPHPHPAPPPTPTTRQRRWWWPFGGGR